MDLRRTWYQIATNAAFQKKFEKGLVCETAEYTLEPSGTVKVNNSGRIDSVSGPLKSAIGKAVQVSGGKLKVSFFLDIFGPYWITQLYGDAASGYSVAVIWSCEEKFGIGERDLWILSRTPQLPADLQPAHLYDVARGMGIDVESLDMVPTLQAGCW